MERITKWDVKLCYWYQSSTSNSQNIKLPHRNREKAKLDFYLKECLSTFENKNAEWAEKIPSQVSMQLAT